MSDYYKHDDSFDPMPMQEMIYKLNINVRNILWGKKIEISFNCSVNELTFYDITVKIIKPDYLYSDDLEELNEFMENSHYHFHSIELSPDKHILIKYVR